MRATTFLLIALGLLFAPPTGAAPPQTISYQGYLASGGTPVNTTVAMEFRLYTAASGGSALWTESQPSVSVSNGVFNVVLGSVTPITLAFDVPYYLGIAVGGDAEMTPRVALTASPYAFRAAAADSANRLPPNFDSGWFYVTSASGDITVPHGLGALPSQFVLQQCGALSPTPNPQPTVANPSFGSCTTRVVIGSPAGFTMDGVYINPLPVTMSSTNFLVPMNNTFLVWNYWTSAAGWDCPGDADTSCWTGYYRILAWR